MALIDKKILTPMRHHQDNANTVIGQASTMKALFDQGAEDLRVKLNGVIDELLATTGAQQIGIDPARGLGNTLADALTNIKNYMNLGASSISAEVIGTGSGDNVQAQLLWLKNQIQTMVLGQIPEASITLDKLAIELANKINTTDGIGDLTALTTTEKTNLVGAVNELVSQSAQKPSMTTAPITLYVSTSGNDSNDGLTPATALRNIQTAIDKIPQVVNHQVSIILSAGKYNEDISISGFVGKGLFTLKGGTTLNNDYVVERIASVANSCAISFDGVNASKGTTHAIYIINCLSVRVSHCSITSASIHYGIVASRANVWAENCIISNRGKGIYGHEQAHIMSVNNSGNGNTTALESTGGSVISKYGTQPTGTVNETTTAGGVIR